MGEAKRRKNLGIKVSKEPSIYDVLFLDFTEFESEVLYTTSSIGLPIEMGLLMIDMALNKLSTYQPKDDLQFRDIKVVTNDYLKIKQMLVMSINIGSFQPLKIEPIKALSLVRVALSFLKESTPGKIVNFINKRKELLSTEFEINYKNN